MTPGAKARRAGFTLIETLAVVLIFALLAGLALPNLGLRSGRALEDDATRLAATLEFGRQRAVMTGVPHRLIFDLDAGVYWLEWSVPEDEREEERSPLGPPEAAMETQQHASVPMEAPRAGATRFRALPGALGGERRLDDEVFAASVETPSELVEAGRVEIRFERDGTSAPTELALANDAGQRMVLELGPLSDTVGIRHDT